MSAVAAMPSVKDFVLNQLQHIAQTYVKDLAHIPADKLLATPMGAARNPLEFTAECVGYNRFIVSAVQGETPEMPDQSRREAFYRSFNTLEKGVEGIESSVAEIMRVVSAMSDEELNRTVRAPWGAEMPAYAMVATAAGHMMYHDGQINYIQSLYGDAENHWASY